MKKVISIILVMIMVLSVMTITASAVSLEKETNDSYSTATVLKLQETISGSLNSGSDVDYYKIKTESNGKISFDFKHKYQESDKRWEITIYQFIDGSYNELSSTIVYLTDSETVALPSLGVIANGIYYIRIKNGIGNTHYVPVDVEYQISTSFIATNYYEKEINNSYASATSINVDNYIIGLLNNGSDVDYYKIQTKSSGEISLTFEHTYFDSDKKWEIVVFQYTDGKYNKLSSTTIRLDGDESIKLPVLNVKVNEIYYVIVRNGIGNTHYVPIGYEYKIILSANEISPKTYNLSYDSNGGSGAPPSQNGKTTYTISSIEPIRSGYEFLGWSTSETATSAKYESGDKISLSKDTTLYAIWEEIPSGGDSGDSGSSSGGDSVGNFTIFSLILVPFELIADFFVMLFDFLFSL